MRNQPGETTCAVPGGLLLVNKPKGWRSFDVVRYFQRLTRMKKIGHSGTLDEPATGLMILAFGKDTKALTSLLNYPKKYLFRMVFGAASDTLDRAGLKWSYSGLPWHSITEEAIRSCIKEKFTGEIEQIPPIYSCLKQDGKRLHEYARKGESVTIPSRKIQLYDFRLISYIPQAYYPQAVFSVRCSSGTYIRSLARDLGAGFNTRAHLADLCRVAIGSYHFSQACAPGHIRSLEELKSHLISPSGIPF